MTKLLTTLQKLFTPSNPIDPGVYHSQDDTTRLHLRIEKDGRGLLIINAATVLHLNQTAAEHAYHYIHGKTPQEAGEAVAEHYRIEPADAQADYETLTNKIRALIETPDLDPVTFMDFERETPYTGALTAPYRLDCALTYKLPEGANPDLAPTRRVDRELSTEEWKTIIDKAWEAGIPHLIFTGGEATLREDLVEIISHAEANGQVTGLLTGGEKLTDQTYLNELLQTGLDHLMVALDPANQKTWQALKLILPEDIFTTVHLSITSDFADNMPNILSRLAEMGANALSLSIDDKKDLFLTKAIEEAQNIAAEVGLPLKWDLPVPYSAHNPVALEEEAEDTQPPQGAGQAWLYVEPDGDILPTQGINEVLGNLLTQNWDEIWGATR